MYSGAIDTVGPKETANAFKMKKHSILKNGLGYVAANGGKVETFGAKRIVGYTESGDGVSMKIQHADVKKVVGSVHKMNVQGNVVVLDGNKSYAQRMESGQKTRL